MLFEIVFTIQFKCADSLKVFYIIIQIECCVR